MFLFRASKEKGRRLLPQPVHTITAPRMPVDTHDTPLQSHCLGEDGTPGVVAFQSLYPKACHRNDQSNSSSHGVQVGWNPRKAGNANVLTARSCRCKNEITCTSLEWDGNYRNCGAGIFLPLVAGAVQLFSVEARKLLREGTPFLDMTSDTVRRQRQLILRQWRCPGISPDTGSLVPG